MIADYKKYRSGYPFLTYKVDGMPMERERLMELAEENGFQYNHLFPRQNLGRASRFLANLGFNVYYSMGCTINNSPSKIDGWARVEKESDIPKGKGCSDFKSNAILG